MRQACIVLSFFLSPGLFGQSSMVFNLRFVPQVYYVGDRVEMSFELRGVVLEDLTVPAELPDTGWVDILGISLEEREGASFVVITLIPYNPGTRTLPPIDLGMYVLNDLKIFTTSLLDNSASREISEIHPPILIPGTNAVLAILGVLLVTLPIGGLFMFRATRDCVVKVVGSYRQNLPYRQFRWVLAKIKRGMICMPEKHFYTLFSHSLKSYLSRRVHEDLKSATTREVQQILLNQGLEGELIQELIEILWKVDQVKFAGEKALYGEREALVEKGELFVIEVEKRGASVGL